MLLHSRKHGISIHAPLTGSDFAYDWLVVLIDLFQSTLPLRGATDGIKGIAISIWISIHAPLTGSDYL